MHGNSNIKLHLNYGFTRLLMQISYDSQSQQPSHETQSSSLKRMQLIYTAWRSLTTRDGGPGKTYRSGQNNMIITAQHNT